MSNVQVVTNEVALTKMEMSDYNVTLNEIEIEMNLLGIEEYVFSLSGFVNHG